MRCVECKNKNICKDRADGSSLCGCTAGIPNENINGLKPCPFCGNHVKFLEPSHTMEHFVNKPTIVCEKCGYEIEKSSRLELFSTWNRRV